MSWFERSKDLAPEKRTSARVALIEEFATTEYAEILAELLDGIRSAAVASIVHGTDKTEFERGRASAINEVIASLRLAVAMEQKRRVLRKQDEMNLLTGDAWRTYGSVPGLV